MEIVPSPDVTAGGVVLTRERSKPPESRNSRRKSRMDATAQYRVQACNLSLASENKMLASPRSVMNRANSGWRAARWRP